MIEGILAWIMLFIGIGTGKPLWFVASGVYAIAVYVAKIGGN